MIAIQRYQYFNIRNKGMTWLKLLIQINALMLMFDKISEPTYTNMPYPS